jgi:hypothetical protein
MFIEKSYNDFEGARKQEGVQYFGKLSRNLGRANYGD